ncbi:MAG: GNAT family N-acetyltransferase [Microcoleaceae cyanobacterium]
MSTVFETQRLVLRPIVDGEANVLHAILTDSFVRRYLCDDKVLSIQDVEAMLAESQKQFAEARSGLWFIETKLEKNIIGLVGLWYFFEEAQPQLLYALLPSAIKQGYATEAASRIVTYCFKELGYQYLVASCDQPNLESQKVAARIGMEKIEERVVNGSSIIFFRLENRPTIAEDVLA